MLGIGVEERTVEVVPAASEGKSATAVGTTTTDAQGHFSLSVILRPGAYLVRVAGVEAVEAGHRIEVVSGTKHIDDLSLLLPAP